jgi:hypothetical protein
MLHSVHPYKAIARTARKRGFAPLQGAQATSVGWLNGAFLARQSTATATQWHRKWQAFPCLQTVGNWQWMTSTNTCMCCKPVGFRVQVKRFKFRPTQPTPRTKHVTQLVGCVSIGPTPRLQRLTIGAVQ